MIYKSAGNNLETPQHFADVLLQKVQRRRNPLFKLPRKKRTKAIEAILRVMAKKRKYKFHPHQLRKRREFLCDFVWMRWRLSHTDQLQDLGLVAECEWVHKRGGRHIYYDFKKLLPLKARFKLFIYMLPPKAKHGCGGNVINKILAIVKGYEHNSAGEHFFLLEMDRRRVAKTWSIYHLGVSRNLPKGAARFEKLASGPAIASRPMTAPSR